MSTSSVPVKCTCSTVGGCGKEFIVIPQEAAFYETKKLPLPDHCPACRHRQRMALRSERQLYRRTCDKCKESMLSSYPESAPYVVYCHKCFWENIG
jgi:Zn ribbon nucleic-acid-binding protein